MQTAGKFVILVGELAARMQAGQDDFDTGDLFARMFVDWHTAAVIADGD